MPIKKGASVTQVVPVITGVVAAVRYDDTAECFVYLVDYTDADGQPAQREFTEAQIQESAV